jgi:hypothetical protein
MRYRFVLWDVQPSKKWPERSDVILKERVIQGEMKRHAGICGDHIGKANDIVVGRTRVVSPADENFDRDISCSFDVAA